MVILFVHQNFPGQYLHLAAALRERGERIVEIGGATARPLPGIELHRYDPRPAEGVPPCHGWAADFQAKCLRAEAVGLLLERLLQGGLAVDLVVGHPGWGELLAIKDLLPSTPVHPFVVHQPALAPQKAVSHAPPPADVLSRDLSEPTPQLGLLNVNDPAAMALGAAVLAHNSAGEPLRNPEQGAQGINSPATPLRAQKFPSASSYGFAGPAARAWLSPARLLPEAF